MSRKKFRNSQRQEQLSERSFQEYIYNLPTPQISRSELLRLIRGGEDTYFELKVKLSNSEKITQGIIALANTDGGIFVFGVNDQLRIEGVDYPEDVRDELVRICREEIYPPLVPIIDMVAFDNGRRIVVLEVEGKKRPYRTIDGKFYLRFGAEKREISREELSAWLDEIRPLRYENIPVIGAGEDDIDDALLWSFARAFEDDIVNKFAWETMSFLKKDLLLAVGNQEETIPTVAAILLFGKNEKVVKHLSRSPLQIGRFSGNSVNGFQEVEKITIEGNLLTIYENGLKFINRYCDLQTEKTKNKPKENSPVSSRGVYHRKAVCEALVNALIHRDFGVRDVVTKINIFDDSLEFINPRRTNGFIPPASRAIRYGITQRINPQIASIFLREEYGIEKTFGGLPMILRESQNFSGKRAEVSTINDEFKLKLYSL